MKKPVQEFTPEYLEACKNLTPDQILQFIEDFKNIQGQGHEPLKLISIKIPPALLRAFKAKAKLQNIPYQTKIKELMVNWLESS